MPKIEYKKIYDELYTKYSKMAKILKNAYAFFG